MRCVVCEAEMARYRCRYCKAAYCSSACFKRHRDESAETPYRCSAIIAQQQQQQTSTPGKTQAENNNEEAVAIANDTLLRVTSSLDNDKATAALGDIVHEDADTVYVLQEPHLAALASDKAIRNALRSEELQSMLRIIDGSHSRLDALDAGLHNSADFRDFCNRVTDVLDRVERARRRH